MPLPPLTGSREAETVVIGCGIAGAAVALELARRGRAPLVLEAAGISAGADAGHVRVGLAGTYAEAIERFGRTGACEIWESQRESRVRLEGLLPQPGACGYRGAGGFRLVESHSQAGLLAESEDLLRDDGFSGEFFDHHMLEARFDLRGCSAGYWAADDADLDAGALMECLVAAAERAGATIHAQSPVAGLDLSTAGAVALTGGGGRVRAERAIVAAGAGSARLLPWLADRLVVRGLRRLRLDLQEPALPSPGSARGGLVAWRSTPDSLLVCRGEPEDPSGAAWPASAGSVRERIEGEAAFTRDALPLLGHVPGAPALVAAGFGGAALGQAFEAARWLAEAAAGRDVIPPPWRAARV